MSAALTPTAKVVSKYRGMKKIVGGHHPLTMGQVSLPLEAVSPSRWHLAQPYNGAWGYLSPRLILVCVPRPYILGDEIRMSDVKWNKIQYELTENQVKLLRQASVWWDDGAYEGAPAIDSKRPFGNGNWADDVAEILGLERLEADDGEVFWPKGTREKCEKIYRTLDKALQVVLASGSFQPGIYMADEYHNNWVFISEEATSEEEQFP